MLTINNLTKVYGEKPLFKQINTIIRENDRIGLVGINGTGKSTFLKVIADIEPADEGELIHANAFSIAYLSQDQQFNKQITVLDYIFAGEAKVMQVLRDYEAAQLALEKNPTDEKLQNHFLNMQEAMDKENAWEASTVAKTILSKIGVTYFDSDIQALSGGQQKRVALAKALIQPADLLILDEPTNHLDDETIVWLEQYLITYPGAILLVTHDRYFLNHVTNKIFELSNGNLYEYDGNYELYVEEKLLRQAEAQAHKDKHANILRQEMAWLKRGARARSTKQKARIERIEDMQEKTFYTNDGQVEIQVGSSRLGKDVMLLENTSKKIGDKILWHDLDLLIAPHDRIGIIGPNGAGKSTFLDVVSGKLPLDEGVREVGETVKLGYYKQGAEDLDDNLRVIEYIKKVAEVITTIKGIEITAEQMLERFLFPRPKQWSYIKSLSGGEKRRLYLLKVLMQEPNVLLLDEPTNDLDIQTLTILEDYIEHFPGVLITVSHDRYFLDRIVDTLLVFNGHGEITRFDGNYSEYMEKKARVGELKVKKTAPTTEEKPKRKKLSYLEQKEWETIEDEIMILEEKVESLENDIVASGDDYEKIRLLYEEQKETEVKLEEKMIRWETLSLLVEALEK